MQRGKSTKCLPAAEDENLRDRRMVLLLIAPSAIVTVVIALVPILLLARMSFSQVSRFGRIGDYVGLQNFARLAADPVLPEIALRTGIWTASVVAGTVLIALPTALILNQRFFGRGLAQFLVLAPWAISLTSMAVVWRRALSDEAGLLNRLAVMTGLIERPIVWLGSVPASFSFEIMIAVLVSVPFSTVIFLAGLSSIPADIYDAARLAGASAIDRLKYLTLPLLRPFIWVVLIFNIAYVTNSFPIIWILTQGGPANSTDILVTYLYKLAFTFGRLGEAAALSVVMLCGLAALTVVMLRALEAPDYA
jgi:multiple sugar transport system permease protein